MCKNILFTVCARAGSKGVQGKNVRELCGKPIVYYTLDVYKEFAEKHKEMNVILAVNTDSELLIKQINQYEIDYIWVERKEELAGDTVGKADVIIDTLFQVEEKLSRIFDVVIDLDLTSPLRKLEDIEGTLNLILENKQCNFAYSVVEARRNPYFNMVCIKENGFYDRVIASEFTARQQVPKCYDMNASVYAYARDYLLDNSKENRRALIWIMEDNGILDIDSEKDFEMMQAILKHYKEK